MLIKVFVLRLTAWHRHHFHLLCHAYIVILGSDHLILAGGSEKFGSCKLFGPRWIELNIFSDHEGTVNFCSCLTGKHF